MDFESPDVEREFPGLYASESGSGKKSQESDFSDDAHERSTKKELLIGKRKDKKESKKDQGYAALEGESSPEEDLDIKSPCKSKKSKSFKFPTIKEKREKSREKDVREKDKEKEREKDKDKELEREKSEKKKDSKSKLKLKDKKKAKSGDETSDIVEDMPVFGVPLSLAVERCHCHDGVQIPVMVRDCIDQVQENGLTIEGIYKISGVKSKVQHLRRSYNKREVVNLSDYDLPTVTSLLKTFLRELPDSLFTADLVSKFEEVSTIKELAAREQELKSLLLQLPSCNMTCLSWIMRHLENVAVNESHNKMGISALGTVMGPVLQTSARVVSALLTHCNSLFPKLKLVRYIPPLSASCTSLPKSREAIAAELAKQESLLNQIHAEMNNKYTVRQDQLWEVQRFITLLKRKLRGLEKAQEAVSQSTEKVAMNSGTASSSVSHQAIQKSASISPSVDRIDFKMQVAAEEDSSKVAARSKAEEEPAKEIEVEVECRSVPKEDETDSVPPIEGQTSGSEPTAHETTSDSASVSPSATVSSVTPVLTTATNSAPTVTSPSASAPSQASAPSPTVAAAEPGQPDSSSNQVSDPDDDREIDHWAVQIEQMELQKLQTYLLSRISSAREELDAMRCELKSLINSPPEPCASLSTAKSSDTNVEENENSEAAAHDEKFVKEKQDLYELNVQLREERDKLVKQIMSEHEACIGLRIQLDQLKRTIVTE